MAVQESNAGRVFGSIKLALDILIGVAALVGIILLAIPFFKVPVLGDVLTKATVAPLVRPVPSLPVRTGGSSVQAVPTASYAQIEATSIAVYQATAQAANIVPNTDLTGDVSAPVLVSKPAESRQPAGDNVPTAEPAVQAESGGIFGSKPVLINPQETHTCKHGQKWVAGKGCKNP